MRKVGIKSLGVLFVLALSCTSNDDVNEAGLAMDLMGSWDQMTEQEAGKIVFTYTFNEDSSYLYKVDFYGFNGKPKTERTDSSETSGTFEAEGDSLFFKRPGYEGVFKSKFWIEDNVLNLEYISYPADAPVLAQMEYQRVD